MQIIQTPKEPYFAVSVVTYLKFWYNTLDIMDNYKY